MNTARTLLACSLAVLLLAVVLGGGGCANGGDASATGDDDSSVGDDTTDDGADGTTSCAAPKKLCGSTCTSTTNDPKNCGTCGTVCGKDQVCTGGACIYQCSGTETLCNAPPEAGAGEAGGGEGGATEGGSKDAGPGPGDAGGKTDAAPPGDAAADAAHGDAGDGAAPVPYCANLGNDTNNCGACGHQCLAEHTCTNGSCLLSCGNGQTACSAADICIPTGTCCSSTDCPVNNEICPQPGGKCQCPGGETVCSSTNSCISSSDCCTDADCSAVAGAHCPTPGQACQCPGGQKACPATKQCIPQTTCCTAAGECCADTLGKSCGAATGQGTLTLGQTVNAQGLLTAPGEEDWIQVTFNDETSLSFHAHVFFTANPNNEFVFDLASDCKNTLHSCGEGGLCQNMTEFEVFYQTGSPAPDPTGSSWAPIPALGTTYIRIHRVANGAPTCDGWALAISE
jgi:hypothetical protein